MAAGINLFTLLFCALQGFSIPGDACSSLPASPGSRGGLMFLNNVAHSNLVGLVLRAVSDGGPCTALANFTAYLSWDFGVITLKGITTDVVLQHIVVAGMFGDRGRCELARQPTKAPASCGAAVLTVWRRMMHPHAPPTTTSAPVPSAIACKQCRTLTRGCCATPVFSVLCQLPA